MKLKIMPFPLPLNVGTDIVHLPRIMRVLAGSHGHRFLQRILRSDELSELHTRFQHLQSCPNSSALVNPEGAASELQLNVARWVGGRFAAKEAARKAAPHGAGSISWKDVWVRAEESGSVQCGENSDDVGSDARLSHRPEVVYLRGYRDQQQQQHRNQHRTSGAAANRSSNRDIGESIIGNEVLARVGKLTIAHDGDYIVATVIAPSDD